MGGVLVEIIGTHCSGKTAVARALSSLYGFGYVAVEAEECWGVWGEAREYCFLAVMGSKWLQGYARALRGERIVVDHSPLGVASYALFFGDRVSEKYASQMWVEAVESLRHIGVRHLLVVLVASRDVLVERCRKRSRSVAGWEEKTAVDVQRAIMVKLDLGRRVDSLVLDTSSTSVGEIAGRIASALGLDAEASSET